MKRRLARLYPRAWRERYGVELEALIEDDPRSTAFDVLKGALTMQFTQISARTLVGGFAVAGLLIAVTAWAAMPNVYRSVGTAVVPLAVSDEELIAAAGKALAEPELRDLMAKAGIEPMRRQLAISKTSMSNSRPDSKVFMVHVDSPDPGKAQVVASGVLNRLAENLPQPISIIDAPLVPQKPLAPYLTPILIAGVLAGAACGVVLLAMRKLTQSRV